MLNGSFYLNGITFNDIHQTVMPSGYIIQGIDGLFGGVPPKYISHELPHKHGTLAYPSYLNERTITLTGFVLGVSEADTNTKVAYLARASTILAATVPFKFQIPGMQALQCWVKTKDAPEVKVLHAGVASFNIQLVAPDPFIYSQEYHTEVAYWKGGTIGGGTEVPTGIPLGIPGALPVHTGDTVVNAGTIDAAPVLDIHGYVKNPTIVNSTTGKSFRLNFTIVKDNYIRVNTALRLVRLNGTANRYSILKGTFFSLAPGDNLIKFKAAVGSGAQARLEVNWRDTYV
jgi:phage-related protein